jgi:hypothetical protein
MNKRNYWVNPENQSRFFSELAETLNIKKLEDWYNVETRDVEKHGGGSLLRYNNHSLYNSKLYY